MAAFSEKPDQQRELLQRNKGIDPYLVQRHQELEDALAKLGVDTKPKYSLSPPLGPVQAVLNNGKSQK